MMKKIFTAILLMCFLSLFGCTAYSSEKPTELQPALPACVYYNGNLYSHVGDVIYYLPEKAELIGETNNVGSDMKSDLDSTVNGYVYTIPDNSTELLFQWKEWDEQVDGKEPFLVLHSSSENESVSTGLFASATPSKSVISMSYYDGTEGVNGFFSDQAEEENVVLSLNTVEAFLVTDWTPDLITYPAYGFMIGSEDGNGYRAFWSNGYLVMRDGKVYLFDYDFGKIWEEHTWRDEHQLVALADMPCGCYLARNENGWIASNMHLSDEPESPGNISITCIEWTDEKIVYELENTGSEDWQYGSYYSLEVLLDGNWYKVPMNCDYNYGFTDECRVLKAGETKRVTVSLTGASPYSNLPAGHYRLVTYGAILEADV